MESKLGKKTLESNLVPTPKHLYAVYYPKDKMELQIMIGHHHQATEDNIMDLKFEELKVAIPKSADFKLFHLSLDCYEKNDNQTERYINYKNGQRQIWNYQIKLKEKRVLGEYDYYETMGKFREISETPNIFIFDLKFEENEKHSFYKKSTGIPIKSALLQNLCFMLSFIETNRANLLLDFITQFKLRFEKNGLGVIEKTQVNRFYSVLNQYLDEKGKKEIQKFETFQVLICAFGLLPQNEKALMNSAILFTKGDMLLQIFENQLDKIAEIEENSVVYDTMLKGLSFLILFEEAKYGQTTWQNIIAKFSYNKKFIEKLIQILLPHSTSLGVLIKPDNMKMLQSLSNNHLLFNLDYLSFTNSLAEFLKTLKDLISSVFKNMENEPKENYGEAKDKIIDQNHEKDKDNDNAQHQELILPEKLSENQTQYLNTINQQIKEELNKHITKKDQYRYTMNLDIAIDFLQELSKTPDYLKAIFQGSDDIRNIFNTLLHKLILHDIKSIEKIHTILTKLYDPFILCEIDKIKFLNDLISLYSFGSEVVFYFKFFELFMIDSSLNIPDFELLIISWLKRINNKDRLFEQLDEFYEMFKPEDKFFEKKRQILVEKFISVLTEKDLTDKINGISMKMRTNVAINAFKQRYIEDVIMRKKEYLVTDNIYNPLIHLQKISKDNNSDLIKDLINYCLSQIEGVSKEKVLVSLFENPRRDSLVYMVLTGYNFFCKTLPYQAITAICLEILKDIQNLSIELKWIFTSEGLQKDQRKIMIEQFNCIVDQNNLIEKDSKNKLDVVSLITECQKIYNDKISIIDQITDFINAYCSNSSDAQEYINILQKSRDGVNQKKISDITFPEELGFFQPFVQKLNPFINSVSFEFFRKKEMNNDEILNCKAQAEVCEKYLEYFQDNLTKILENPNIKAKSIKRIFSRVKDVEEEIKILRSFIKPADSQYLKEILKYMKEEDITRRICQGIQSCVKLFDLSCDITEMLESGCHLSFDAQAKDYHAIHKTISKTLNLELNGDVSKILIQFQGADELLAFTLARKNKTEIDFMKEAVNDYDESHLSTQAIFDFTNFWNYITELSDYSKGKPLLVFLEKVKELSENKTYAEIKENFQTSKINFYGIQNLYIELTHKEESKRKQIFNIIDYSLIKFIKVKKEFDVECKCKSKGADKDNLQIFRSIDIFELQDRANLVVYSEQKKGGNQEENNYKEEELEKFKAFCSLTDVIHQLINMLNQLSFNGYPDVAGIKIVHENSCVVNTEFVCKFNKFDSLHKFKDQLNEILKKWNSSIIQAYKQNYELTFLKGKDFWKVEKALKEPKFQENAKGIHLLNYIGKKVTQLELDTGKSPEERLFNLGEVLKNLPNIHMPNEFPKVEHNYTFFVAETSEIAIIKGLLTLYVTFEKEIPFSHQILICNDSTSRNELDAFAYRCFFNPNGKLFCLIQPERLSFSLQDEFSQLIKRLNSEYPNRRFCLAFVTSNMAIHLVSSLKIKNQTKLLKNGELLDDEELKRHLEEFTENCKAVTSNITGFGKTTWIKNFVKSKNLIYHKIPISGVINPVELGKTLIPILQQENVALCFTIGSIDKKDKSLLNEILFSLVILRSFHFSKNVIEIPKDLQILFEIDSSYFEKLTKEIEILGYLQKEDIEKIKLHELEYKSTKIQFVCHYLKGLGNKSLGNHDLEEHDIKNKTIPRVECVQLLLQIFLKIHDESYLSYTQLNIFINALYSLFKSFSESGFFRFNILSQSTNLNEKGSIFIKDEIIMKMRLNLIEGLVLAADQFTSKSVETVRNNQKESMKLAKTKVLEDANEVLGKAIVSWENTRPFTVVFSYDQSPIFVYKHLNDIPKEVLEGIAYQEKALKSMGIPGESLKDYQKFTQIDFFTTLSSLTNRLRVRNICLKCYRKYEKTFQKCIDCEELLMLNNKKNPQDFVEEVARCFAKDYALTPDNFIKMLLIFSRVQQNIPIIIMGETGCGKTSLIKYLSTRVLDDEFHALSIHAGINQEIIVQQMETFITQAEKVRANNTKIWIFFDEFNTTSSIGLIKEILCERTMLGKPLPENMVFLGACNPWRFKTQKIVFDENVGIKKDRLNQFNNYNLLYTVHPLPETMIDFVWDYGHLDKETEKKYIDSMFSNIETLSSLNLKESMVNLVCLAHKQFREWEDVSSVSLRDVARYKILFKWFSNSIKEREELLHKKNKMNLQSQHKSAILSLLHCYYLRISSKKRRNEFLSKLEPEFNRLNMNRKDVENLLYAEEMDFLDRMKPLPEGIAENQALRENIFALIVCIMTKIPIFICGKPGCSKSLAVQLVFAHLRGRNSREAYFRTLPELIPVSFQGSEYCTSESILGVFNRAEKYLNINTQNKEILPVIVFDEIGLAEISANNPLKVLHNKLEIENLKVGFVGISNWRLDASKMNRALYLARPDPDIEDLKFTAKAIYSSIGKNMNLDEKLIEALARIYSDLKELLKEERKEDIFGLRDYYFLIKGVSLDLSEIQKGNLKNINDGDILYHIVRRNIKKNFSGLGEKHDYLWRVFCLYMGKPEKEKQIMDPPVKDLILNNLKDRNSRYLMLITQSDCVSEYIESMIRAKDELEEIQEIKDINQDHEKQDNEIINGHARQNNEEHIKEIKTLVGSHMENDLTNQSYGFKVLSDIILYIEKGYTLIFKKIDHIYSSLYDLFNQSFSWSGDKKYCRVALGALYNPKCLVHKDFHCVILISEKEVEKADPPFLNRFEKYKLKIEDILDPNERLLKEELEKWITSIIKLENYPELIKPEQVFVNYNSEYLFSLIIQTRNTLATQQEDYNDLKILEACKKQLISTSSFDFPVLVSLNINDEETKEDLLSTYYKIKSLPFKDFVDKIISERNTIQKKIVYTYTQISEDIVFSDKTRVKEIKFKSFRSETEILDEVLKYFASEESLLVIRIELIEEIHHLPLIKHLILNCLNSHKHRKGHHLMILIHLQRYNVGQVNIDTLFQDWESIMFDNINHEFAHPIEFIKQPSFQRLMTSNLLSSLDNLLEDLFDRCLSKVKYNVEIENKNQLNERRNYILGSLKTDSGIALLDLIKNKIIEVIGKDKMNMRFRDWRKYILLEEWIRADAISSVEAMDLALTKYYEGFMMKIIYQLEKDSLLDSYLEAATDHDNYLINLWKENFPRLEININERLNDQVVEINSTFGLSFPFSTYEEVKISSIQENIDEVLKKEDRDLLDQLTLEKFVEMSFFGEKIAENLFEKKEIFDKYFKDQLYLSLKKRGSKLHLEFADLVLDNMFMGDRKAKFLYFLTCSKECNLVFNVIEALITMEQGRNILRKSLKGILNLDEINQTEIVFEALPKYLLLSKNGVYYNSHKEDFLEFGEKIPFEDLEQAKSEKAILYLLFQNIVEEVSSCNYISKFKSITEIKSSFRLLEEKIIKTGIFPDNMESFRPWIDLLHFIEICDKKPDQQFNKVAEWLKQFEDSGIFSDAKTINKLIHYLKEKVNFKENLEKPERERKIMKLHTQFYKNLISLYEDEFFEQVLGKVDEDPDLWKNSGKIINFFDNYTTFSESIMAHHGNLEENIKENSGLETLENILSKMSEKIKLMMINQAFVTLESEWRDTYQQILAENFIDFKRNFIYFERQARVAQDQGFAHVAFLAVSVWLKTYLYFYSIALENDEREIKVLKEIDVALCEISPEISTLKLYVLKNLKIRLNKSVKDLRKEYAERNVLWIKPFLKENPNKDQAIDVIVPLPLYQSEQFRKVDLIMADLYNLNEATFKELINFFKKNPGDYNQLICIYSWFLRLYSNYLREKFTVDPDFIKLIKNHEKELIQILGEVGYSLIILLMNNFDPNSFFHLKEGLKQEKIYQKLVALNTMIVFIAQQFTNSGFGSILFENKNYIPELGKHLEKKCLFGQLENTFIVSNMIDVKINIEKRLRQRQIFADAQFIYKCSTKCDYLYYFEGCGRPIEKSTCRICESEIGASSYNVLLLRNNGLEQMKMPIPEGIKYIDDYIKKFESKERKGYLFSPLNENAKVDTKHNLKPITFRTLHFLLHTVLFGFTEIGFISKEELHKITKIQQNINAKDYFKKHFEQDYKMIGELVGSNESYIWIYQILSSFEKIVQEKNLLDSAIALQQFERKFEDQIMIPAIQSINAIIQKYRRNYVEYQAMEEEEDDITIYLDELKLEPKKYPWLQFFNSMKLPSFADFSNQFELLIGDGKNFPLLDFVLKRHKDLSKISSLPSITDFTNYLMKKFNYQISRDVATTTVLKDLFEADDSLVKKFKDFEANWNQLDLDKVRVHCQEKGFQKLDADKNLSLFLPNINKDESGILIVGTMISLAVLQNEFIYMTKRASNPTKNLETIIKEESENMEILQTVKVDQVINISKEQITKDILQNGYIHNFEYGKGREIIYDFEEIENKLHQYSNGRKIINEEKLILMNYQFELYNEAVSIFSEIRKKNPQEILSEEARRNYRNLLKKLTKKDLLAYLGSLDYVFTYLQNLKEDGNKTIENFATEIILNYQHLNEHVTKKQPFSSVSIKHILDLYETLEEIIFDKAIQDFIRPEFSDGIPPEEQKSVIEKFDNLTIKNPGEMVYPKLKEPDTLAKVFKKLILRILLAQVNIENRLFDYFAREDMWGQDTDINEIYNIELPEDIKLKHSYIILKHLEEQKVKFEEGLQVQNRYQNEMKPPNKPTDVKKKIVPKDKSNRRMD